MIYPQISLENWVKKYRLKVEDYDCEKCGKTFKIDIPVLTADSAGLQSKIHGCGQDAWAANMTPKNNEKQEEWRRLLVGEFPPPQKPKQKKPAGANSGKKIFFCF